MELLSLRVWRCNETLNIQRAFDVALETEDGEGRQATVDGDELAEVVDDDLAIDEVQSALCCKRHHFVEGLVDGTLDFDPRL